MTPMEQRLARRIHKQRARLRQLECFLEWRHQEWVRSRWMGQALKLGRENKVLKDEISRLRRERDDALRAAWAVRDLATPPVSDEDVERAVAEARRVRQDIEGRGR